MNEKKQNKNTISVNQILIINQSAIARRLRVSPSYINRILSGERHSKKYETKIKNIIDKAIKELRAA